MSDTPFTSRAARAAAHDENAGDRVYRDLERMVRAGASVVHLVSHEEERLEAWCAALCEEALAGAEEPAFLYVWDSASGVRCAWAPDGHQPPEPPADSPHDPIEALDWLKALQASAALLLLDAHPYLDGEKHPAVVRAARTAARALREQREAGEPPRLLVLSAPVPRLPVELAKEVPSLEIPLPGHRELGAIAASVAEDLGVPLEPDPAEPAEKLLEAARGLTIQEARIAFGRAAVQEGRLGPAQAPLVAEHKRQVLRQSEVLEYHEPDAAMDDVGGMGELKRWLRRRGRAFSPEARAYGLEPPRGVLLLGVQGCGKSMLAKAVAAHWGMPLLRMDVGKAFGSLLGETEGALRTALKTAEALAPCIVWIDEIEKGLAGTGSSDRTDGGTTARVVGTLLTWMQERSHGVFVVATANRIDLLPPELLRKGRFDELFFVDLPAPRERRTIFELHLRRRGRDPEAFDLERLAEASYGFSGAEIESALEEALFDAFDLGEELETEHVLEALRQSQPLSRTMAEEIEGLRRWAGSRARRASDEEPEPLDLKAARHVPRLPQERSALAAGLRPGGAREGGR